MGETPAAFILERAIYIPEGTCAPEGIEPQGRKYSLGHKGVRGDPKGEVKKMVEVEVIATT